MKRTGALSDMNKMSSHYIMMSWQTCMHNLKSIIQPLKEYLSNSFRNNVYKLPHKREDMDSTI